MRFPLCHGQVVHEIVATGGGCGAWHFAFVLAYEGECLNHQLANLLAGICSVDNEIVAREASHWSPIDDVLLPSFTVAEVGCHKMFYGVKGSTVHGRLVVRCCHSYVVGGESGVAKRVLA